MTDVQVFRWFCKEQGIMANIRGMYYVCSPKKYALKRADGDCVNRLTFEEWIHGLIASRGFCGLLDKIADSYNCNLVYNKYDKDVPHIEGMFTENFRKAMRRWNYFVSKNIIMDNDSIKIGDVVSYKNPFLWGDVRTERVIVDNINLKDGYLSGHVEGTDGEVWENKRDFMSFCYLRKLDNIDEELEINYSVKRNRRTYNGVNRK